MTYEAVFYDGWADIPAYYVLDSVDGETAEDALAKNLDRLVQTARDLLNFASDTVSDLHIKQAIYVLRGNGLVAPRF
jgi:hypothetical protein